MTDNPVKFSNTFSPYYDLRLQGGSMIDWLGTPPGSQPNQSYLGESPDVRDCLDGSRSQRETSTRRRKVDQTAMAWIKRQDGTCLVTDVLNVAVGTLAYITPSPLGVGIVAMHITFCVSSQCIA